MRGRPDRARQQPRGPLADDGGGRAVGDLALEEGQPFGEAIRPAERGGPVRLGQRPDGRRWRPVEASPVALHPGGDRVVPPQVCQRLGRHRTVIGQAERSVDGRGGGEDREGIVEGVARHRPSMSGSGPRRPCRRPLRSGLDDRRSDGDDATAARHQDHRVLGTGAGTDHHAPGGPRGRGHQGRTSGRRLHPRDDLADRRGHVPHAPAPEPRQAVPGARPAHGGRRRHPEGARNDGRRGRRGDAPRIAGPARRRVRRLRARSTPRSSSAPSRATA